MKQYLINNSELLWLSTEVTIARGKGLLDALAIQRIIDKFLKSKKPVEVIAEGKVKLETRYESQLGEEVTKITIGKENLKMVEILKDFEGKPVKIIIVKGDKNE